MPPSCLLVVCISIAEAEQYQAMGNRSSVDITGEDYKKQKRSETNWAQGLFEFACSGADVFNACALVEQLWMALRIQEPPM